MRDAFEYLEDLQNTVGARLSGSPGEAKAKLWLEAQCRALGLAPEAEAFTYRPEHWWRRLKYLGLAVAIAALTLSSAAINPWLILLGVMGVFALEGFILPVFERKLSKNVGYNIIAGVTRSWSDICAAPQPRQLLLVCAHYDTAPAMPAWRLRLRRWDDAVTGLAFLGVLGLATFCLIYGALWASDRYLGWGGGWAIGVLTFWRGLGMWLVAALGLPMMGLMAVSVATAASEPAQPVNPGADDNGSGVAVVLALAHHLKQAPPPGWEVAIAFWGAEEVGLTGSYSFVNEYQAHLDPARTVIINVDTVGRGDSLMAVAGQGVFFRHAVDESLVRQWELACEKAGARTIREWLTPLTGSSDHAAWLSAKFYKALSIGRGDLTPISLPIQLFNRLLAIPAGTHQTDLTHIHSTNDTLTSIEREKLGETTHVIRGVVRKLTGDD